MSSQINLEALRAELNRKLEAIDLLLGKTIGGRIIKRARKIHYARKAGRRKMSAAGRARLAAYARARWKKARAQGKSTL